MTSQLSKPETVAKAAADLIEQIDTGGITEGIGDAIGFKPGFVGAVGRLRDVLNRPAQQQPDSRDALEVASIAFTWSYANALHDKHYPDDPAKDGDGLTSPAILWAATPVEEKEFMRQVMKPVVAALAAVPPQDSAPQRGQEPDGSANLDAILNDQPFLNSSLSVIEIQTILKNEGGFMPDEAVAWFRASRGKHCHWCQRGGDWPTICRSTRDMQDKPHDPICDAQLMRLGGGERSANQARAASLRSQEATATDIELCSDCPGAGLSDYSRCDWCPRRAKR